MDVIDVYDKRGNRGVKSSRVHWEEAFEMISTRMLGGTDMLSPQEERVSVAPISGIYSHSPLYKTAEAVLWLLQCRCESFAQYQHHQSEQKKKDCLKTTFVRTHL